MKEFKVLKTSWTLGEPNLISAKRQNDAGLCAGTIGGEHCLNKLPDPPCYGFLGLKICAECRKPIDKMMEEIQEDTNERVLSSLWSAIGEKS